MRISPPVAAVAVAVGIAAGPVAGAVAAGGLLVAALVAARVARRHVLWLALLVGIGSASARRVEAARAEGADDRVLDRVAGIVQGPIAHGANGDGALLDSGVYLWAPGRLVPGDRVEATGLLRSEGTFHNPATVARHGPPRLTARELRVIGHADGFAARVWGWADDTQRAWDAALDDPALRGIVAGDRGDVPKALDTRWRAAGIYHVLSVSGLHLAVVAGLAFWLLRRVLAVAPFGGRIRPDRWAAPPALVLAVGYTLVTGAQLATLRSLVAVALVLIGAFLERPVRVLDAIGIAALAILVARPVDLYDPSFQLSFVAAATLARIPRDPARGKLRTALVASAWVTLTTAPLTAYHFQQIAIGGIVGNLVLAPAVELFALPAALLGLLLHWRAPIRAAAFVVGLADRGAGLLAQVAPVGRIAVASSITLVALLALSMWIAGKPRYPRLAWLALCLAWAGARDPVPAGELRVTFLDVGQGDAALIELPDGAAWLVDAGGNPGAVDPTAPGAAIVRELAARAHDRVELAILSHPHPDHYLGFAALAAARVPVDEIWVAPGPDAPHSGLFASFADVAALLDTRIVHPPLGVAREEAGVQLVVLAPSYDGACAADPVRTVNDNSLVVALRYRGRTIVFAGDLEAEGEQALVDAGLGAADLVKVPHHGSPTSSTAPFVAALHPRAAIISCGRANRFGFPSPAVVDRWRAAGADVLRTDEHGAITAVIGDDGALEIR
ncbi:MAG TPA: DNA internalization-related competence protein ComEC/Rec2 [Kofleriaceae bacterium]|jgi:competence protein ComEC